MYIQTVPYFCWSFQHYFFNIKAQPNGANGHPAHFIELSRSVATADSKLWLPQRILSEMTVWLGEEAVCLSFTTSLSLFLKGSQSLKDTNV